MQDSVTKGVPMHNLLVGVIVGLGIGVLAFLFRFAAHRYFERFWKIPMAKDDLSAH